jgi:hypothetical protein
MWSDGLPYGTGMQIGREIRASYWASYLAAYKNSFLTAEEAKTAYRCCFTDSARMEGTKETAPTPTVYIACLRATFTLPPGSRGT